MALLSSTLARLPSACGRSRPSSVHCRLLPHQFRCLLGKEVTLSVSSLNPRNEQPLLEAVATIATCGDLHHPKLHPTRFTDHVLIPRRIPDELNIGFIDAVDRKDFALCIMRDRGSNATARRGQCHLHVDACTAIFFLRQLAIVNESEIN